MSEAERRAAALPLASKRSVLWFVVDDLRPDALEPYARASDVVRLTFHADARRLASLTRVDYGGRERARRVAARVDVESDLSLSACERAWERTPTWIHLIIRLPMDFNVSEATLLIEIKPRFKRFEASEFPGEKSSCLLR